MGIVDKSGESWGRVRNTPVLCMLTRAVRASIVFFGFVGVFSAVVAGRTQGQGNVLTYHNDDARTGLNPNGTVLTPAKVNTNSFGNVFIRSVDAETFAQPLSMTKASISGLGIL